MPATDCADGSLEYTGTGQIDWANQIQALANDGYTGFISIETHLRPKVASAKASREARADALLVFPTPAFLNDPLDTSIPYDYHKAIADASGLPLIVFQLGPLFGGINYPAEALTRILELPQVIGLKDASFDALRYMLTRDIVQQANHPITLLSGNDNFLLESFLLGAR